MKKLPIAGTSAAFTAFCSARVEGPGGVDGLVLHVDGNAKITRAEGDYSDPRPNAFSLVQIADCPGSTPTCRAGCYVHGLEKHAKSTHDLYVENSAAIREILENDALASDWALRFAHWIEQNVKSFRWHVSGDVWSLAYAEWIADVCREAPGVEFWIYTRSFDFADPLIRVSTLFGGNLALNVSCDADNYEAARALRDRAGFNARGEGLRLCYYTRDGVVPADLPDDAVIFPDYSLRAGAEQGPPWFAALESRQKAMVCQVDYMGKSEKRRCGPCNRCLT